MHAGLGPLTHDIGAPCRHDQWVRSARSAPDAETERVVAVHEVGLQTTQQRADLGDRGEHPHASRGGRRRPLTDDVLGHLFQGGIRRVEGDDVHLVAAVRGVSEPALIEDAGCIGEEDDAARRTSSVLSRGRCRGLRPGLAGVHTVGTLHRSRIGDPGDRPRWLIVAWGRRRVATVCECEDECSAAWPLIPSPDNPPSLRSRPLCPNSSGSSPSRSS